MIRPKHQFLLCALYALVGLVGDWVVAGEASAESPTEAVRQTINRVIATLEDPRLAQRSRREIRRHTLEAIIDERFDYAEMSKRTLGARWKSLSAEEQKEFVELFKAFLSDRYAEKIEGYAGEEVDYLDERIERHYAEVRTKLISSKGAIPMDYRLIKKDGHWYAYDIIVDGVSLVRNYRSQFVSIIRTSSYEELVRRLKEHGTAEMED